MKKNVIAIIQARDGGSRLPGKVLAPLTNGKNILQTVYDRVKMAEKIDDIIVATSLSSKRVSEYCIKNKINCYIGSEDNVIGRVLEAAVIMRTDIVVEITADCPLIDPVIIDEVIHEFCKTNVDYCSNTIIRTYADGFDVQVYSISALCLINSKIMDEEHRKHPGWNIWQEHFTETNPVHVCNVSASEKYTWPELGLTLDTVEDYFLINTIIDYFYDKLGDDYFSYEEIINVVRENNWNNINEHIERKIPGTDLFNSEMKGKLC